MKGGVGTFKQRRLVVICNVKMYISVQTEVFNGSSLLVSFSTRTPFLSEKNKEGKLGSFMKESHSDHQVFIFKQAD